MGINSQVGSRYFEVYERWKRDPEGFWAEAAREIDWIEQPKKIFDPSQGVYGRWFTGGVTNTAYNCLDRHVERGRADQPAMIYDSPVTGQKRIYTYAQLLDEVKTLAGVLLEAGVGKGDRVILYLPMISEALIGMLACARIGAIHSVVFGGFAANELAVRIEDAQPKVIISASCGIEPNRVMKYKPLLDQAIELSSAKPDYCIIVQRPQETAPSHRRPRLRLCVSYGRGERPGFERTLRADGVHRSALYSLHLGHDRPAQGCGARHGRPYGRPEMDDEGPLRHRPRGSVLGSLRRGLGCGPLLYCLRAAPSWRDNDPLRGQARRHAGCRSFLARDQRAQGQSNVHGADRVPRHQEGRSERHVVSPNTIFHISRRCFWPASAPIPTRSIGPKTC